MNEAQVTRKCAQHVMAANGIFVTDTETWEVDCVEK